MKKILFVLMSAALSLAACKSEEPPKAPAPKTAPAAATPAPATAASDDKSHVAEPGGLPGLADALKGDTKAEEAKPADAGRPMPPAAPTAAPAEGAKK